MLSPALNPGQQIPLIHETCCDEKELLALFEGEWFQILHAFPWEDFRPFAADYYNALYDFNQSLDQQAEATAASTGHADLAADKEAARQRILFDRRTAPIPRDPLPPALYSGKTVEPIGALLPVRPEDTAPGVVPLRLVGRKPKCFFALLKAFTGASLLGFPAEPRSVYQLLTSNPAFAQVCGFALRPKDEAYHYQKVPSLRKLEQFDQIMTDTGLWGSIKSAQVRDNLNQAVIKPEGELVGDTTHYHAFSTFEVVHFEDEKGKSGKKSQSRLTGTSLCAITFSTPALVSPSPNRWSLASTTSSPLVLPYCPATAKAGTGSASAAALAPTRVQANGFDESS